MRSSHPIRGPTSIFWTQSDIGKKCILDSYPDTTNLGTKSIKMCKHKALFRRRVAWPNLKSLEVRTCGLRSVDARRSDGAWLCKYLDSARVNGCTDAVWPLPLPLMCELFTAITLETTDLFTIPRATSILPVPTMGNNANRGRNSWEDRP
ncbi:hypothetical protein AVEN_70901-1 [Araneus ventricosus]|uniref:Uncharacterized protein n=1 Tax=Araneus ventricosus TaxID=182803 RepID=A0A4Y2ASP8_ARAVE|nr:hypothetical protein AVEN_104186-1 [Araneus ventricosus]GBL82507.1 hypothetical protein AVEN_70901-1 [Araneus ventricosus]